LTAQERLWTHQGAHTHSHTHAHTHSHTLQCPWILLCLLPKRSCEIPVMECIAVEKCWKAMSFLLFILPSRTRL
jgi:hypothetical protein